MTDEGDGVHKYPCYPPWIAWYQGGGNAGTHEPRGRGGQATPIFPEQKSYVTQVLDSLRAKFLHVTSFA
jgi:hypothetical protein